MKSDQLFKTSYNGSSAFVNLFLILYRRGLKLTFFIRQSWKPQVPWEWFANFGRTYVSEMPNVVLAETNFLRSLSLDCKVPHRIYMHNLFFWMLFCTITAFYEPLCAVSNKNWWWTGDGFRQKLVFNLL